MVFIANDENAKRIWNVNWLADRVTCEKRSSQEIEGDTDADQYGKVH